MPRSRGNTDEEQKKQPPSRGVPRSRGAGTNKLGAAQVRHAATTQRHPLEHAPSAGVHPELAATSHAAPPVPTPYTLPPTPSAELDRGPIKHREVALTFDAGSSPAPTPAILRALQAAHLHCTFFVTGEWTANNPALVRRIAAEGHELGNHTYTHPDLRRLSDAAVARELERTDALVRRLTGRGTRPYFRPPFGARNRRVLRDAARHGYRCVYWTTDSLDSVRQGITPRQIERRVLSRVHPGSIILMHCGSAASAAALPRLLTALHHKGYRVVTISELMRAG